MRLELVCALLVIAVVTIGTSAEERGRNYVDDDALDDVLDDDDDDGRSVRDAVDDDVRSVRDAVSDDVRSMLGDDDGRSVRDDKSGCRACHECRRRHGHRRCKHLCRHC